MLSVEPLSTGSNVSVSCKGDRDEPSKLAAAEACNANVLADSIEQGSSSLRPYLLQLESQYCGQLPAKLTDSVPLLLFSSFVVRSAIDFPLLNQRRQRTYFKVRVQHPPTLQYLQYSCGARTILGMEKKSDETPRYEVDDSVGVGEVLNASGHKQELERQFSLLSICSIGITTGNVWAALGGSIVCSHPLPHSSERNISDV